MRSVRSKDMQQRRGTRGPGKRMDVFRKKDIYIYIYIYINTHTHTHTYTRDFSMSVHAVLISRNALCVLQSLTRRSS